MKERPDITTKNVMERVDEAQKPLTWLTSLHKRLRKEKFSGDFENGFSGW